MNDPHIHEMIDHMLWADAAIWRAVLSSPNATQDSTLRERLLHLHGTEAAFFRIWQEKPIDLPKPESFENIASVAAWAHSVHKEIRDYFVRLEDPALDRIVTIPWAAQLESIIGGSPHPATLAQTMIQVASHSTYHRGQINTRLRDLRAEPASTDFILWVWMGKPRPSWP